jgi:hypothetical protein
MQTFCESREDWTFLGCFLVAYGDDVLKNLAALPDMKNAFGLILRNVDADLRHCLHGQRIQFAWLKTGTLRVEPVICIMLQKSFAHLAAPTIVHADKQHSRTAEHFDYPIEWSLHFYFVDPFQDALLDTLR